MTKRDYETEDGDIISTDDSGCAYLNGQLMRFTKTRLSRCICAKCAKKSCARAVGREEWTRVPEFCEFLTEHVVSQ
jgi:hypothetical protein